MKIGIVGDVHFCTYSSLVRSRGVKYSTRLENLIESINWAEKLFSDNKCDLVIYLGDFFDQPNLTAEEISALQEINWYATHKHFFIVGNHESNIASLIYNSTNTFKNTTNFTVAAEVSEYLLPGNIKLYMLPYILENDRKPLVSYFDAKDTGKRIVLSHNDIKGIQYGSFISQEGFSLDEIKENCGLFINGHIHNGSFLNKEKTILNLGNLTGQNFNEDAYTYSHRICILETSDLSLQFFENPYAFNFYKINMDSTNDLNKLDNLKNNAVLSIKCSEDCLEKLKEKLSDNKHVVESRTIIYKKDTLESSQTEIDLTETDYLKQFNDFMIEKLGSNDVVMKELMEVCR